MSDAYGRTGAKAMQECAPGVATRPIDFATPTKPADTGLGEAGSGKVIVKLAPTTGLPEEVKLFFVQHLKERRKQQVFAAGTAQDICVELPRGEYTMQVLARGFETFRGLVQADPDRPFTVQASFKPRTKKPSTFAERLAKYGIDASKTEIVDLNVPARTTRALNHKTHCDKHGFQMLSADSIAKFKQWIGSDDAKFGHDRPVFGPVPALKQVPQLSETGVRSINPDDANAITAIAREYVHGNSKAVAQYESLLNEAIKATTRVDMFKVIPLFFYRVVTIGPGATLEVGNGSAIFTCDELRIHKTGRLKPVNSVTIEVGTYTEFG
jgi:hypothetical protein